MATFTVLGGDCPTGIAGVSRGMIFLPDSCGSIENGELLRKDAVASVVLANEESVKKIGGAMALGAIGGLLLGPVGLVGGALLGRKNKKTMTFILALKDGRNILGECNSKDYAEILAVGI